MIESSKVKMSKDSYRQFLKIFTFNKNSGLRVQTSCKDVQMSAC